MAHRPSGSRPSGSGRTPRVGLLAAAGAGVVVVMVALAVGVSQATSSPACAAVIIPAAAVITPAAASAASATAVTDVAAGARTSGEATHYELAAGGMGNCSYPSPPAGQLYVALPPPEYGAAAACGSYVQVTGPDGSVTVEVIDQCPECQAGHIDLSEQAFARIAPLNAGLVPVSYHTLVDPPLPAPLSMLVKSGSSAYYLALLPVGTGNSLASVAVSQGAGNWRPLTRTTYGYWIAPSGAGPGPFTVRLADSVGHRATVSGIRLAPGVLQPTGTSMYGAVAAAPVATTAAPAPSAKKAARVRRTRHRDRPARATASPARDWGISISPASSRPAAASPTPSCH